MELERGPIRFGTGYGLAVLLTSAILVLLFLPPVVDAPLRLLLMKAFSAVCHQLPERTLSIAGVPLAVCSRCVGIYTGLVAGTAFFPLLRRGDAWASRWTGLALLVAIGIPGGDWLAGLAGLWESGHAVRLATGSVFGVIAGYFLARAAAALPTRDRKEAHPSRRSRPEAATENP